MPKTDFWRARIRRIFRVLMAGKTALLTVNELFRLQQTKKPPYGSFFCFGYSKYTSSAPSDKRQNHGFGAITMHRGQSRFETEEGKRFGLSSRAQTSSGTAFCGRGVWAWGIDRGFESGRPTKSRSVRTETDTAAIRNVYYTFVNLSSFGAFDGVDDVSLTINHTQGQGFGFGRDHAEARFG